MRVITHAENRGYGQALRSGFAAATKDLVFYTDGDGQYDVGELPRLLAGLRANVGWSTGISWSGTIPGIASASATSITPSRDVCSAFACVTWIAISG